MVPVSTEEPAMVDCDNADPTAEDPEPTWEAEPPREPSDTTEPPAEWPEVNESVGARLAVSELRLRSSISCSTLSMISWS